MQIGSITTGAVENDFVNVAFSPDCRIVAAGGNGIVNEWDMVAGNRIATLSAAPGNAVDIDAFTPNGKALAVAGGDGNTTLWNAATGRLEARFPSDPSGGTYCGRPGLRRLLVSYLLAASLRCQASRVAGVTAKTSVQRLRGMSRASATNHIRSAGS